MNKIPIGIGPIGKEQYQNELQALVGGVIVTCEQCEKEYTLKGGMQALINDFDQEFICEACASCHS